MNVDDCEFCKIVAGAAPARVLHEGSDAMAFFPLKPAALGHTLVIPKDHVPDIYGLSQSLAALLAEEVVSGAHALRQALQPDGLNVINSTGEAASQSIFHLHIHLVPRWQGDQIGNIWPPSEPYPERTKDIAAEVIREAWVGLAS